MPYPEPPGTQGQKIEPRSGKQGPFLEGGPVLGPILGGRFWGLFPKSPSKQKFRTELLSAAAKLLTGKPRAKFTGTYQGAQSEALSAELPNILLL